MQGLKAISFLFVLALFFAGPVYAFGIKCKDFNATKAENAKNGYVWIDCRDTTKFTASHEKNVLNIPMKTVDVIAKIQKDYPDKTTKIILYHDELSTTCIACALARLGYVNVTSVALPDVKDESAMEKVK